MTWPQRTTRVAFLTLIWVLLWGSPSFANVASGVLVSVLLMVLYPTATRDETDDGASRREPSGVPWRRRPLAVARLAVAVIGQLIASNALLAREIVTPGSRIRTGIVACRLRNDDERMVTLIANCLALCPGTMPVHVQLHPTVIHVHVLHLDRPVATRRQVARLEARVVRAFGTAADIERLGERLHHLGAGLELTADVIGDEPTARRDGKARS